MGTEGGARVPEVGAVLAGKYRVTRLIGEGGMGVVLEAEHLRLRQLLAIKFLNPTMMDVVEVVKRFEREARAAATLRSRHVVRVSDVEATPEGLPYIVMELLEGHDLENERETRGTIPYEEVVDYVLQACSALGEAHDAGIVHRDLKPSNLFLAKESQDAVVVKVLDFGISKFLKEESKLTSAGSIVGTILYMSPEQIRGRAIDGRSDIWSLGVILYELLTGEPPWSGSATKVSADIVSEEAPDIREKVAVPDGLANTIHAMLTKPVDGRPQTVAEVMAMLAPFAPTGSIGAEVASAIARRSTRSVAARHASSPSLQLIAEARTVAQVPERSTISATTSTPGLPVRQRAAGFIALAAVMTLGLVIVMYAFVWRPKAASESGVVGSGSATLPTTTTIATTPSVSATVAIAPESPAEEPAAKVAPPKPVQPTASGRRAPIATQTAGGVTAPTAARSTNPAVSSQHPPLFLP